MIRKHMAKVLTVSDSKGKRTHFVLIGGVWYHNGSSETSVETKSKDGFWDDESIKTIVGHRAGYTISSIARLYKGCKTHIYIREWTTEQVVYGVPF